MPIPTSGDVCKHFLSQFFEDVAGTTGQQPEFVLGVTSLRRIQLVALGEKVGLKVSGNMKKDDLVRIVEGAMMDGLFDDIMVPMATEHQRIVAALTGANEALTRSNEEMAGRLAHIEEMLGADKQPGEVESPPEDDGSDDAEWTPEDIEASGIETADRKSVV